MPFCRQCGKEVNQGETFCRFCGARLAALQAGTAGTRDTRGTDNVREETLALFVGKNADTYLDKFRNFSRNGADSFSLSWHWPAFFFGFFWTLYRRLYLWALLLLCIGAIPHVGIFASFAFGASANYIYYRHAKKKLSELGVHSGSETEYTAAVARAGGVNNVVFIVAPLVILAILAAVAIPRFEEYRQRAYDQKAQQEIQDACYRGKAIFASQPEKVQIEPEDLLHAGLIRSPDIEMMLLDGRRETFSLSAKHLKSQRTFVTDRECRMNEDGGATGQATQGYTGNTD